jgi:hypothetical protein
MPRNPRCRRGMSAARWSSCPASPSWRAMVPWTRARSTPPCSSPSRSTAPGQGVPGDALISALESAAAAGQPMALWQLGTMYENGEGVTQTPCAPSAISPRSPISTPTRRRAASRPTSSRRASSRSANITATACPPAGITVDMQRSHALLMHAATLFRRCRGPVPGRPSLSRSRRARREPAAKRPLAVARRPQGPRRGPGPARRHAVQRLRGRRPQSGGRPDVADHGPPARRRHRRTNPGSATSSSTPCNSPRRPSRPKPPPSPSSSARNSTGSELLLFQHSAGAMPSSLLP